MKIRECISVHSLQKIKENTRKKRTRQKRRKEEGRMTKDTCSICTREKHHLGVCSCVFDVIVSERSRITKRTCYNKASNGDKATPPLCFLSSFAYLTTILLPPDTEIPLACPGNILDIDGSNQRNKV